LKKKRVLEDKIIKKSMGRERRNIEIVQNKLEKKSVGEDMI